MVEELTNQHAAIGAALRNLILSENEKLGCDYQEGLNTIGFLLTGMEKKLKNIIYKENVKMNETVESNITSLGSLMEQESSKLLNIHEQGRNN